VYLHLELDRHDVIRAEGAWSETYIDCGNRQMFHNASGFFDRFKWPSPPEPIEYAQRWESGDAVDAVRARLARHATAPADAAYRIRLDQPGLTRVVCPPDVTDIHLISPIGYASGDFRPLGALLTELRLNGQPLPLTHPALARGFHRLEQHGDTTVRWTNGAAVLAVGACSTLRAPNKPAERTLEITIATLMQSAA
jgi:hypothetical protein